MASKLHDPLGMLSPVTLAVRLFTVKLWDQKFGWDQLFTDASKSALGVAAYLTQDSCSVLLGSKSKIISQSKDHLTIPQLELSAMFLGSQYCDTLLNVIKKDFSEVSVFLWTDSEIALFWLASKRKLKQFVQNKVDAINSTFDSSFWGHTPTQDNPADVVSRGCSAVLLKSSALWQYGPNWLCNRSL